MADLFIDQLVGISPWIAPLIPSDVKSTDDPIEIVDRGLNLDFVATQKIHPDSPGIGGGPVPPPPPKPHHQTGWLQKNQVVIGVVVVAVLFVLLRPNKKTNPRSNVIV